MAVILQGILHAAAVVFVQLALAQVLVDVPAGARAQGVGAILSTLLMLAAGLVIGIRRGRQSDERPGFGRMSLSESSWHWEAVATAGVLSVVGLLAYFVGVLDGLMPEAARVTGGIGRAMFATDAVVLVGLVFVNVGFALGFNARPGAFVTTVLGYGAYVAIAWVLGYAARYVSYETTTVAGTAASGFGVAALLSGFGVAWFRRRMSFVELTLIALLVAYSLYMGVALGPTSWTKASNLPEEQILLAVALFPLLVAVALLNVGGSLGFLLSGGGRFDPGLQFESQIALRYLSAQSLSIVIGFALLVLNGLIMSAVGVLMWIALPFGLGAAAVAIVGNVAILIALQDYLRRLVVGLVTMIAIGSVCLGVMALIIVLSIMSGFEDDLKKKILGAHAHVVINKKGDDFVEYREVARTVRKVRGVGSGSAFVLGEGMISTDIGLSGTLVKGVDLGDPEGVADLRATILTGALDHLQHPDQILGARPRVKFQPAVSPNASTSHKFKIAYPIFMNLDLFCRKISV